MGGREAGGRKREQLEHGGQVERLQVGGHGEPRACPCLGRFGRATMAGQVLQGWVGVPGRAGAAGVRIDRDHRWPRQTA